MKASRCENERQERSGRGKTGSKLVEKKNLVCWGMSIVEVYFAEIPTYKDLRIHIEGEFCEIKWLKMGTFFCFPAGRPSYSVQAARPCSWPPSLFPGSLWWWPTRRCQAWKSGQRRWSRPRAASSDDNVVWSRRRRRTWICCCQQVSGLEKSFWWQPRCFSCQVFSSHSDVTLTSVLDCFRLISWSRF